MNIREFRDIVTIYEEGSISRAAEKLHLEQSSLSKFLMTIEKNQGYQIFDRSSTPLTLTELGCEYIKTAKAIVDLATDLDRKIDEITNLERGVIKVGINMTRSFYCLHEILPLFIKRYPKIHIEVTEARTTDLTDYLLNKSIDVMIVDGLPSSPLIDYQMLINERFYLVTPPGYIPEGPKTFIYALQYLLAKRQKFILLPKGTAFRDLAEKIFVTYNICPNIEYTTQMASTAVKLCVHGLGLSFVSSLVKEYYESSIQPDYYIVDENFHNPVIAAYRKGGYLPRSVQPFIDIIKSYLLDKQAQH